MHLNQCAVPVHHKYKQLHFNINKLSKNVNLRFLFIPGIKFVNDSVTLVEILIDMKKIKGDRRSWHELTHNSS